jgi:hypothetical protein
MAGDVWVVRAVKAHRRGDARTLRGTFDPRIRRTSTLCRRCWTAIDVATATVDLPCRACGRIRHCDAATYHGTRFLVLHACSPECARAVRRRPVRFAVTLRCDWCGTTFTARTRNARFCSTAHRKAAHRAIHHSD